MLALFRIVELTSGFINIDGYVPDLGVDRTVYFNGSSRVDISMIDPRDLRTKVAIIPQDVCRHFCLAYEITSTPCLYPLQFSGMLSTFWQLVMQGNL